MRNSKKVTTVVLVGAVGLASAAYGIGSQVPQTLLDTMTGIELINDELVRIEYGDLA